MSIVSKLPDGTFTCAPGRSCYIDPLKKNTKFENFKFEFFDFQISNLGFKFAKFFHFFSLGTAALFTCGTKLKKTEFNIEFIDLQVRIQRLRFGLVPKFMIVCSPNY